MIYNLSGTVHYKKTNLLVLNVSGVGYGIHGTSRLLESLQSGQQVTLWTYHVIKEQSLDLFGFDTLDERALFEKLISVSGIGPRSALAIMDLDEMSALVSAIASGNSAYLTQVSGVGKRTAERLIVELQDKLEGMGMVDIAPDSQDVIDTLVAMGYQAADAREALRGIDPSINDLQTKIAAALKLVAK